MRRTRVVETVAGAGADGCVGVAEVGGVGCRRQWSCPSRRSACWPDAVDQLGARTPEVPKIAAVEP